MPALKLNPRRVKLHRSYDAAELARLLGVHRNTVWHWRGAGLAAVGAGKPVLFQGATVRAFLASRNASRKRPCSPGTMYCLRCRGPRRPALGMVEYEARSAASGNLTALCETCGAVMNRRVTVARIAIVMPGVDVTFRHACSRLNGKPAASLNSDFAGMEIER